MKQPIKKSPFIALAVVLLLNVTVVLKTARPLESLASPPPQPPGGQTASITLPK